MYVNELYYVLEGLNGAWKLLGVKIDEFQPLVLKRVNRRNFF